MALRTILAICTMCCCKTFSFAQPVETQPGGGIELGIFGPSMKYPAACLGAWKRISERDGIGLEFGYGGKGLYFHASNIDRRYTETHERFFLTAHYLRLASANPRFLKYFTVGPYGMWMNAKIGQGFIEDYPEGALTAHFGATFKHRRIGILPGSGLRFAGTTVSFDLRFQIPVYYEWTKFIDITDPILITDFEPQKVEDYQRERGRISAGIVFSARAGIVFRPKTKD